MNTDPNKQVKILGVSSLLATIEDTIIPDDHVVVQHEGIQLYKKSFMRLRPGNWLNDECINAYSYLINQRENQKADGKHPITFAFDTFFYT